MPAEAMKADMSVSADILEALLKRLWEDEVPAEWKEGYVIKIAKKGRLDECKNYRGITLLVSPGKVMN